MINDAKYVEKKCMDCNNTFTIRIETVKRKESKGDNEYRCPKCLNKLKGKRHHEWYNNLSADEKAKLASAPKQYWDSLSAEEKNNKMSKLGDKYKNWVGSLSGDEKSKRYKLRSERYHNKSAEEKDAIKMKRSDSHKREWNNRSDIDKSKQIDQLRAANQEWRDNVSDEELSRINKSISDSTIRNWNDLPDDEKERRIEILRVEHDKWYQSLSLEEREALAQKRTEKFRNLSREEREMISKRRNVLTTDDCINSIFNEMRLQPFPEPHFSDKELLESWNRICKLQCNDELHNITLNTRIGDRLIQHFHTSIWMDHRKGDLSPYDAWNDDELLRRCIENRIIYQTNVNPNKILQGFNVSKIAPKVSVFSAGRAKIIIDKYLSEYNEIFDPFSGYSGRMLGTISLGKTYIGQDISTIHVNESNKMIKFLYDHGIEFNATVTCKNVLSSSGKYQCLFTCSPYADKEQWQDVPISLRTCDDWIDECLKRFDCDKYVFVVDKTTKYNEYVVDEISNKSHLSNAKELVIVIKKEEIDVKVH